MQGGVIGLATTRNANRFACVRLAPFLFTTVPSMVRSPPNEIGFARKMNLRPTSRAARLVESVASSAKGKSNEMRSSVTCRANRSPPLLDVRLSSLVVQYRGRDPLMSERSSLTSVGNITRFMSRDGVSSIMGLWVLAPLNSFAFFCCLLFALVGILPSASQAAEGLVTDAIVVKYRAEGDFALKECAERISRRGESFASHTADGRADLDQLFARFGMRSHRALFRSSDRTGFENQRRRLAQRLVRKLDPAWPATCLFLRGTAWI